MAYDNEMSGVLFKNDKKQRENQPDYTGKLTMAGVTYRLAAWIKSGAKGKFFSIKVSEFDQAGQKPAARPEPPQEEFFDDDIAF